MAPGTVGDFLLERLGEWGVRRIYGYPGDGINGIMGAFGRAEGRMHVGIIDEPAINAANAGGGNFYVTTGLLQKASEAQLRGVMAHEIAHEDLGHVAQMQVLGAGLNLGVHLLEELIPGSSAITPIAGTLIARGYSRDEKYEGDGQAVDILQRAGYSKETLVDALAWIARSSGGGGGGFLSTHPATSERIAALKN